MKKALLVLAVLCVAGIFSAKAQSPSDSSYVRNLNFSYINVNTLPYTATGSVDVAYDGKYLKDLRMGCRATGYTINLTSSKKLDIILASGGLDSYLYILDTGFNVVLQNDDWNNSSYGSRILYNFPAGQYFIIVTDYYINETGTSSYTLTVDEFPALAMFSDLTYTPLTIGTPVTDTLKTTDYVIPFLDSDDSTIFRRAYYAKAYSAQINSTGVLEANSGSYYSFVYLTDNNYNIISRGNSYSQSHHIQTPGTYRIIVTGTNNFDYSSSTTPFTLTTSMSPLVNFNTMTYTPLGTVRDTTVYDTFTTTIPFVEYDHEFYRAKGYSLQGTQNKALLIEDSNYSALYILMDNNHNILRTSWYNLSARLPQTGTYYIAVLGYSLNDDSKTHIATKEIQTYYVDAINGNDARNGLTPGTALATLDTAIARSGGIGKYYLTEDYTFNNNSNYTKCAQIYPYQKDIKLKLPSSGSNELFYYHGDLVFGEEGSNYYFILDSSRTDYNGTLFYFISSSYASDLQINNMKVRNSHLNGNFAVCDGITLRNFEFTNDTIEDYRDFIESEGYINNYTKLINCNISNNNIYRFLYFEYTNATFTMENTTVAGNTFYDYYTLPLSFYGHATANLTSGSWRNNRLSDNYYYNNNPNITVQNAAGIEVYESTLNIGAGFSMDMNNYLWVDTASRVIITENLTAPIVAQLYPYYYNEDDYADVADYYEGRRVLWGTPSLLANNYQKFSVAQADNSSLWYIHPDGTIHTSPVSIDQAEEGTISLYPNPANNVLNIALQGTEVNEAVVIDIYGKTVARTTVSEGNNTLNISALPAGMYFVQLRAAGSVKATQKIIKN